MPYEKNNGTEKNNGKKSVTKKSTASSGSRQTGTKSAGSRPTAPSSGSRQRTSAPQSKTTRKPAGASSSAKPKTSSGAGTRSKTSSQKTAQTKSTPAEKTAVDTRTGKSSARDDYKKFAESTRKNTGNSKSTAAKKTVQTTRKKSGEMAKSQSRSKLATALTYTMLVFAFLALMIMLSLTVFFKIDTIKVEIDGKEIYSEEQIKEISGVSEGENIFSVDTGKAEKSIEKLLPYIEDCDIKRSFPTGIRIKAETAKPAGVITLQTGMRIIVSEEGKCLETLAPDFGGNISETDIPEVSGSDVSQTDVPAEPGRNDHSAYIDETALPEIIGLDITDGIESGNYIVVQDKTALATLSSLMELLGRFDLQPTKVDLSAGNLYAYYDNRIVIKIGSGADLETKIEMAGRIIHERLSEYDIGRVDVSNPKKGYFTPEYMLD